MKSLKIILVIFGLVLLSVISFSLSFLVVKRIKEAKYKNNSVLYPSIPKSDEKILDKLPENVESGKLYFYKNINNNATNSYISGKILFIDKDNNNIVVGDDKNKNTIHIKNSTIIEEMNIKDNKVSKINFSDLYIRDNVGTHNLVWNNIYGMYEVNKIVKLSY